MSQLPRWSARFGPVVLAVATVAGLGGCQPAEDVIKIGVSCPMTGDQAKIGQDMLHGAELAAAEINAAGGILGKKVVIDALDDQHNPTQAVAAAHRFVADRQVVAVVAHLNSNCTMPASEIYAKAPVVMVTPCSTNVQITQRGYASVFRMCANDAAQGRAAADWAVRKLHLTRIYVVDDKSTYGQGLADEFTKSAKGFGARLLGRDSLVQGEKDFSALLTRVRAANPALIFFGGMYPEGSLLAKQARELGIKAPLMGGDGLKDDTLVTLAGPAAAEGSLATMVGADPSTFTGATSFVAAYAKAYGPVGPYSPYAYDAVRVVVEAIRRAGIPDRDRVIAEVRNTKDFKGVTGVVNFDDHGDTLNQTISVYAVKRGAWLFQGVTQGKK